MDKFGDRLKAALIRMDRKASYLSKALDVTSGTVSRWVNNEREPDFENVKKIAGILNTSVAYLMGEIRDPTPFFECGGEAGSQLGQDITELPKKYPSRVANGLKPGEAPAEKKEDNNTPSNGAQIDDVIFVPIVSNKVITACCGNGSAYAEEVVWEYEGRFPVPAKVLMGYTWQGCSYRIMEAEGSSMEPYIYNGDQVLFVEYCDAGVGDIVVVSINNRLFIKGIVKMNEKELCLRAYNWQISPDMVVNLEGDTEVCILGKVINVVSARSIPKMI